MRRWHVTALSCLVVLGACSVAPCVPARVGRDTRPTPGAASWPASPSVPGAPLAPPPLPAPAASTSASEMIMEANGWTLPVTHAVATTHGGEALTVWVSNAALSCESARRDSFATRSGQQLLRLRIARPVTRTRGDARFPLDTWVVRSVHAFQSLASDATGAPTATAIVDDGLAIEGHSGRLEVHYDAPDQQIRVRGTTLVTGCGIARTTRVVPRLQPRFSLVVGDETLPVLGATLGPSGLHLSTAPLDCGPIIPDRDVDLRIFLGTGLRARHGVASGDRMPPLRAGLDAEALSITAVGAQGIPAPTVTLAVTGTLGQDLERPIRLSGMIEALRCDER